MEELEEKVSELEAVLGRFIVHTDVILRRMERDTAAFREEMSTFREEVHRDQQHRDQNMETFREEVRRDQQHRDQNMETFREEVRRDQQQRDENMNVFREEIRRDQRQRDENMNTFREEIRRDQQQRDQNTEQFKGSMNKRWGELANRLGTVVEDIVAPNLPIVAERYFGCVAIDTFALRVKRMNQVKKEKSDASQSEFDAILTCQQYLFVNETKAKATSEDVKAFVEKQVKKIFEYFPEYEGKTVVPIFSSLSIPEATLKYLTKNRVYAMSSKGDTMDLLNFEEIQKKK